MTLEKTMEGRRYHRIWCMGDTRKYGESLNPTE